MLDGVDTAGRGLRQKLRLAQVPLAQVRVEFVVYDGVPVV
jgi:hypothetical protein